ncbi:histone H1.10-like [Engystomops pustulosus]|uniref:histone H1.10-like n=1 Tax=Engystomops pustulosus TaxID=76066 RepID=UPI003AFAB447
MSLELEETVPSTEDEEDEAPAGKRSSRRNKGAAVTSATKKKNKKNQPGRYSQLVVDTIRKLGERNGSSLAKIYSEAKKVSWFDQQNGRTYLKYSIKALVQNDTLLQVKGVGANGSFRLNKKKLEGGGTPEKKAPPAPKPAAKKPPPAPKKAKPKAKKEKPSKKKAGGSGGKKVKSTGNPGGRKVKKTKSRKA